MIVYIVLFKQAGAWGTGRSFESWFTLLLYDSYEKNICRYFYCFLKKSLEEACIESNVNVEDAILLRGALNSLSFITLSIRKYGTKYSLIAVPEAQWSHWECRSSAVFSATTHSQLAASYCFYSDSPDGVFTILETGIDCVGCFGHYEPVFFLISLGT